MKYYFPFLASIILITLSYGMDAFADSDYPMGLHIEKFGMFDAKDEGNLTNELQVGKTYWFKLLYAEEVGSGQGVKVTVKMTDSNKDVNDVLVEIDTHDAFKGFHLNNEHEFEWTPVYPGKFLITVELSTEIDSHSFDNYAEFDFIVLDTFADNAIPFKECPDTHFIAIKNSTAEPICVTNVEKLVNRHHAEFFYDYLYENENIFNPSEQQLQDAIHQKIESTKVYQLFTDQYEISEKRDGIWGKGWGPFNLSSYSEDKTKTAFIQFINSPEWGLSVHVSCKYVDSNSYATIWSATYYSVWESGLYESIQLLENNYCLDDYVPEKRNHF